MNAPFLVDRAMARELAVAERVCVRPLLREVSDRETGTTTRVAIACGSTREQVCPSCATKARILRMEQCTEGWHRTDETLPEDLPELEDDTDTVDNTQDDADDQDEDQETTRRVRSTRHRNDTDELPGTAQAHTTLGRTFTGNHGRLYRPSMFLTLTLPSYGAVHAGSPIHPDRYDYRRAALDALHFPKLVDRFWQNLRRVAGYKVQYFAAVEPQTRLAPHLHAAIRGTIPRKILRQVVKATYVSVWWPAFDTVTHDDEHRPVWDADLNRYLDPDTGELLPSWNEAIDALGDDATPVHTMRFGTQMDMAGIIAPSPDADRAVRYLTKYLAKSISDPLATEANSREGDAHIERLHAELRYLPCSPRCANWLRYGVTPQHPRADMHPGWCRSKAHDRAHLGLGGRRVLVSRDWSGKTLTEHRADRADVVRHVLEQAGILTPDIERMAANVIAADGQPRYVWADVEAMTPAEHTAAVVASVLERQRWRAQYEQARNVSAMGSEGVAA
ncbi:MAG: replication initiator [Propionicimonas sp.]